MPLVTVLLPTRNRADVLPLAIQSVLAQTVTDLELFVVGDGCTDDTAAVVGAIADPRLRWFDRPKAPGFGYANRNVALRHARGQVIAYMAHDDLWFPDHLARLLDCLSDETIEFAYSLPLFVSTAGHVEPMVFNLNDPLTWRLWHERKLGYLSMACVVHRRACLERYGYWNEHLRAVGDWELWMRIMRPAPAPNFIYYPAPTGLHFVANWRRYDDTRARRWWRRLRDEEGGLPPALKLDLRGSATEQAAAWQALQADPVGWPRAVRAAVQLDLDRRGAYRLNFSDLLEAGRRRLRAWRTPPRDWSVFSPPDLR
jgi:glycosyltransferase involved in cell wall biosynthesis